MLYVETINIIVELESKDNLNTLESNLLKSCKEYINNTSESITAKELELVNNLANATIVYRRTLDSNPFTDVNILFSGYQYFNEVYIEVFVNSMYLGSVCIKSILSTVYGYDV